MTSTGKSEYDRKIASLRRIAREAEESARAERKRAAQEARWQRDREEQERDKERLARDRAAQEARRPKAECCGGPLFVVENGEGFCRQCYMKRFEKR